jgi:hypothetical protein
VFATAQIIEDTHPEQGQREPLVIQVADDDQRDRPGGPGTVPQNPADLFGAAFLSEVKDGQRDDALFEQERRVTDPGFEARGAAARRPELSQNSLVLIVRATDQEATLLGHGSPPDSTQVGAGPDRLDLRTERILKHSDGRFTFILRF